MLNENFLLGYGAGKANGGGGSEPILVEKTITENGTYSATDDNADGYSQVSVDVPSIAFYSGTLTLASRPASTGVYATLDAPNCTHFVMYAADNPDTTTNNAFFGFGIVEKGSAALGLMSNNAGTSYGTSSTSIVWNFTSQTVLKENRVTFNANNIALSAIDASSTAHLPQAGLGYNWFAW